MTKLAEAIRRAHDLELELAAAFAAVADRHPDEPDVFHLGHTFAKEATRHASRLRPFCETGKGAAARAASNGSGPGPSAGSSLLDDLCDLFVLTQRCWIEETAVRQAALAKRDRELLDAVEASLAETAAQAKWERTRIKTTAPQALTSS
jgi:hypothetical protein